jgi:glucose-1-phosphate cytidylyltransferase
MKVVLFCGGLGTRLQEYSGTIPKPMVEIGYRPIMWHLMRYYAHYGHKEFILCLGYRGDVIKQYFLNYNECISNDFQMRDGGRELTLWNHDIDEWTITFVDTGQNANIGERLMAVRPFLNDDEVFMANYTDGLSDLHLPSYLEYFQQQDRTACFLSVKPSLSFHVVDVGEDGNVNYIQDVADSGLLINGGFFVFRQDIFDYMQEGEELVIRPFQRLIADRQLATYRYDGFWASMDTFKEKKMLDDMYEKGETPWAVWRAEVAENPRGPLIVSRWDSVNGAIATG